MMMVRPGLTEDGPAGLGGKRHAAEWLLGRPRSVLESCEAGQPTGHNLKLPGPQPLAGAMLESTRLGHDPRGDKL